MLGQMLNTMFSVLWGIVRAQPVLVVFIALAAVGFSLARLPVVKGWLGETLMKIGFAFLLPKDTYRVIHNVTIPDGQGGTTQIDHVVVSRFGLFVVETKNYKGLIFGGEYDSQWTQKIHRNHSQKFQNPLRHTIPPSCKKSKSSSPNRSWKTPPRRQTNLDNRIAANFS